MHIPPRDEDLRDIPAGELYFYMYRNPESRLFPWIYFVMKRRDDGWHRDDAITNGFAWTRRAAARRARRVLRRVRRRLSQSELTYAQVEI